MTIPYLEANLRQFLARYRDSPGLRADVLCKTKKGREVELLHLGRLDGQCRFRVLLAARHHACETMASYGLEGILESVLADTDEGRWFRQQVEFLVVPFMDKDGVEEGDQGKGRQPRDHNEDYAGESSHASVRALRDLVPRWSQGRLRLALDMHCPSIRGGWHEQIYFVCRRENAWPEVQHFSAILKAVQTGPLRFNLNATDSNAKWRTSPDSDSAKFAGWAGRLPGVRLATTIEIPYANAGEERSRPKPPGLWAAMSRVRCAVFWKVGSCERHEICRATRFGRRHSKESGDRSHALQTLARRRQGRCKTGARHVFSAPKRARRARWPRPVLALWSAFALPLQPAFATAEPGLAGYWTFEEGTGITTADLSGSGFTGTLLNGPQWVPGRIGRSAPDFDGVDDSVNLGNPAALLTVLPPPSQVKDARFSVDRGFFSAPFQVEITTETPGAVIRYTRDGSGPATNRWRDLHRPAHHHQHHDPARLGLPGRPGAHRRGHADLPLSPRRVAPGEQSVWFSLRLDQRFRRDRVPCGLRDGPANPERFALPQPAQQRAPPALPSLSLVMDQSDLLEQTACMPTAARDRTARGDAPAPSN